TAPQGATPSRKVTARARTVTPVTEAGAKQGLVPVIAWAAAHGRRPAARPVLRVGRRRPDLRGRLGPPVRHRVRQHRLLGGAGDGPLHVRPRRGWLRRRPLRRSPLRRGPPLAAALVRPRRAPDRGPRPRPRPPAAPPRAALGLALALRAGRARLVPPRRLHLAGALRPRRAAAWPAPRA